MKRINRLRRKKRGNELMMNAVSSHRRLGPFRRGRAGSTVSEPPDESSTPRLNNNDHEMAYSLHAVDSWSTTTSSSNLDEFLVFEDEAQAPSTKAPILIRPNSSAVDATSKDHQSSSRSSTLTAEGSSQTSTTSLVSVSSQQPPPSLPQSVEEWLASADALLRTQEMSDFVTSSRHVVCSAGDVAVKTALLPVTLPIHVVCSTTDLVVGSCVHLIGTTGALIGHGILGMGGPPPPSTDSSSTTAMTARTVNQQEEQEQRGGNPLGNILHNVFGLPGVVIGIAGKIKNDVGSAVVHVVAPVLGIEQQQQQQHDRRYESPGKYTTSSGESTAEDYLERLRLDYTPETKKSLSEQPCQKPSSSFASTSASSLSSSQDAAVVRPGIDPSSVSKFLLRVGDLGMLLSTDENPAKTISSSIHYIDLSSKSDSKLIMQALNRLVSRGVSLLSNHPTVRLGRHQKNKSTKIINWKPEAGTCKLIRKMTQMSSLERLKTLEKDILLWSGKLQNENSHYGGKFPFFLARGVVRQTPREFMQLLWDNTRTTEYNNFCIGRSNLLVLEDKVLQGSSVGTKVVKSETRVPFTGMSVMVSCLMHVRPLEAPDEGFVIVSRSLDSGCAGTHLDTDDNKVEQQGRNKNEILWGINVIRRVPNHPHLTDLTSLSQVGSSLVPMFLAQRIGVMGVEDFFRNVRKEKEHGGGKHLDRAMTC